MLERFRSICAYLARARPSGKQTRTILIGILTVALPFAFEHIPEYLKSSDKCEQPNYESVLQTGFYYHRLTRLNRPSVRNKFTRLVTISDDSEGGPATHNACATRELHARVLEKVAQQHPAAVVLDYVYETYNCPDTAPESHHLADAIKRVSSARIPIIMGLDDLTQTELEQRGLTKKLWRKLSAAEGVLEPDQWRPTAEGEFIKYGLARIGCDVEQLPLEWTTFTSLDLQDSKRIPTLAKVAAQMVDPGALEDSRLLGSEKSKNDVLVTFLSVDEIKKHSATAVLCGTAAKDTTWQACPALAESRAVLADLAAKIVIICTFSDDDRHQSPIGASVPGGVLQANYIESLLDGNYYEQAPWWVGLLISFAWYAAIQAVWSRYEDRPFLAFFLVVALSLLMVALCYFVYIRLFNSFMIVWPPGAIAVLGKAFELVLKLKQREVKAYAIDV